MRLIEVDGKEAVEIRLTQGKTALVDLEDWERVRQYRWHTKPGHSTFYGRTHVYEQGLKQRTFYLHRVALDTLAGQQIDHWNKNGLDCRRSNLRLCDDALNQQNTLSRKGTSRFKGVSWNTRKRKWRVAFNWQGKTHFVGYFDDEEDAARAYDARILPLAGAFARPNFP